jgi:predicted HTH domain antitoxin
MKARPNQQARHARLEYAFDGKRLILCQIVIQEDILASSKGQTKHLTGRVPKKQVERLNRISKEEGIDRSTALRKVLDIGLKEYRRERALDRYRKGKISIGKAAEEAGVSVFEMFDILEAENIPIQIDIKSLKEALHQDFGD